MKATFLTKTFLPLAVSLLVISTQALGDKTLTRENGAPVGDNQNSQTAGDAGPVLLQDVHLIEKTARFDRERIPERVVHARGTAAYGKFVSYGEFSDLTIAAPFQKKNKETKVLVRFSSVIHPSGSPETLRDPRGFAAKFYTEQGNWDLVGNNLPVFFIRDAMKFPDMVHSLKPSPVTNLQDPNRFFDFFAHVPESTNMLTFLYSDLGTPATYREMDGNGVHAYKFVNKAGQVSYVKFNWKSLNGVKNLSPAEVSQIQAKNFNHMTEDLYSSIQNKKFPSWELQVQILKPEDLNNFDFNPLDSTKEWIRIPGLKIVKLGKMTLNEVPPNFFEHTEQVALAPSNLIPGIEGSEDRLLQGRLFSYADTQRYRLGINHLQLPVNRPQSINSHGQAGGLNHSMASSNINYQPNSFDGNSHRGNGIFPQDTKYKPSSMVISGSTQQGMIRKTLNFKQAGETFRSFSKEQQDSVIANFSGDLNQVKNAKVKIQIVAHVYTADIQYGERLGKAVNADMNAVKKISKSIQDESQKKLAANE